MGFRADECGTLRAVVLAGGAELPCDTALVAIGARPAAELLHELAAPDGGVATDAAGRTALPDVYACGDVASPWRPWLGDRLRVEHWTEAATRGAAVARAIVSGDVTPPDDLPYFWSDQFRLRLQFVGHAPSPLPRRARRRRGVVRRPISVLRRPDVRLAAREPPGRDRRCTARAGSPGTDRRVTWESTMRWARIARWLAVAAAAAAAAIVVNVVLLDAASDGRATPSESSILVSSLSTRQHRRVPRRGRRRHPRSRAPDASTQPESGAVTTGGAATTGSHGDDGGGSGSDADD